MKSMLKSYLFNLGALGLGGLLWVLWLIVARFFSSYFAVVALFTVFITVVLWAIVANRRKLALWFGIGFVLTPPIFYGLLGFLVLSYNARRPADMNFNSSTWKAETRGYPHQSQRIKMIGSMRRTHTWVGLTRTQIIQYLGVPTEKDKIALPKKHEDYDFIYWVGEDAYYVGYRSVWFGIKFGGRRDIVMKARFLSD